MDFLLMAVVVCASAFWVYWDATANKIGKIPDEGGSFNMSAGSWAMVTLLLWIVGLPAYLINRSRLIEKAKENPRESKVRYGGATALAVLTLSAVFAAFSLYSGGSLPGCNSREVISLTEQIVRENPAIRLLGGNASISAHGEQSYNAGGEVRVCSAVLTTSLGQERVFFSVEWLNKNTGEFWVQFNG